MTLFASLLLQGSILISKFEKTTFPFVMKTDKRTLYFVENYVAQSFTANNVEDLFSWQKNRAEVEFVRDIKGNIIPIEVKAGKNTQAKSLQVFAEKYQPLYSCIISTKTLSMSKQPGGVNQYPLYLASQFPLEESS